ncbi:MAG: helix-turn-helix transcriptional regulator [Ktedonobacteraceae bacterium]|nr:helix-turn-helix transcriptional regulator [Ktedonobacteraceae bacterium]
METNLPTLLRTYRKGMGWTQEEMAQRWSYSYETISAWERGKRRPSNQEIPRLAKLLEISPEELASAIVSNQGQVLPLTDSTLQPQRTQASWKTNFEVWGEVQHIYRNRTEFSREFSYSDMFENAHSILAAGISLNAITLNYSREILQKLIIENQCNIQLCFLDPDGKKCAEREEEEDYPLGTLAGLTRANIIITTVLYNQIKQTSPEHCKHLEVRVYDLAPRLNIYIVDDILMTVQSYGYGRGEEAPVFVLKRKTQGGLFDFYASTAKHILTHSRDINEQDPSEK